MFVPKYVVAALALASSAVASVAYPREVEETIHLMKRTISLAILKNITVILTPDVLSSNSASGSFFAKIPVPINVQVTKATASAGFNKVTYAKFTHSFSPALKLSKSGAPVNSKTFSGIKLVNPGGAAQAISDGILTNPTIDVTSADVNVIITANDGTPIPVTIAGIQQLAVPINFDTSQLGGN